MASVTAPLVPAEATSDRLWDTLWRWSFPALLVVALLLRVQNLDQSPYGDEAYYYLMAHNLEVFWNKAAYPVSSSTFPVFPLFYHLFAGNLESLRTANAIVGAAAVPLGMVVMRELGASRPATLVGGLFLAVDTILIQFSGMAFLDMLGAVIALGAVLAYVRGRLGLTAALVAVAILEKEYYAILGLALVIDQLLWGRRFYAQMLLAAVPVLAWLVIQLGVLHGTLFYLVAGHVHAHLTAAGFDHSIGSLALLPLGLASAVLSPRFRGPALYVVLFALFQFAWGNAQGWYWCLSVMLSTILAAHGFTLVAGLGRGRTLPAIAVLLVLAAFAAQAWTTSRYLVTWHDRDLVRVADYLDGQAAQPVALLGCDWPYRYYPLGSPTRPTRSPDDWTGASTRLAVACPGAPAPPDGWSRVYRSGGYSVLERESS